MTKIISVVGVRPNIMKLAPLYREFNKHKDRFTHLICHTGQHYDEAMSKIFFDEMHLPKPDFYLGIGSGSHALQTAGIMVEFEKVVLAEKPDLVIVVGDVNSTIACSLVAAKLHIKIAHVESGLRSFDRQMPEEINRLLTDTLSDYLFVSELSGVKNLQKSGIEAQKFFHVGNIMIDNLIYFLERTDEQEVLNKYNIDKQKYILLTIHRPRNVDNETCLREFIVLFNRLSERETILFPVHPRTMKNIEKYDFKNRISPDIKLISPVGYLDFINLIKNAKLIVTDSGGIQEESTFLGIQCITLRNNTERPVTVDVGTNHLTGTRIAQIEKTAGNILDGNMKNGSVPELWDGKTAERIVGILIKEFNKELS